MSNSSARTLVVTSVGLKTLAQNPLSKIEGQTLWHLASTLPALGGVVVNSVMAEEISATQIHLNRVMKRLCEIGFLMRGPKVGLSYHYKLNPAFLRILS